MVFHSKSKIQYAPDERGGGSRRSATVQPDDQDEGDEPKVRMFKVGDEEVPEDELIRGYKGTKETTRRFQELSEREKRAAAAEERANRLLQEAEERERRLNATRDELLTRKDKEEAAPKRPSLRERMKEIDFVTADDSGEKVGALFEEEWEVRQAEIKAEHEREMAQLRAEIKADMEKTKEEATTASTKVTAAESLKRQNTETFSRVLTEEFGTVKLTKEEKAAVERKYRQKIGPDYGAWDPDAGAWKASDEAARDAMWSTPEVREKLLKAQTAQARGDGLRARERGERATEATPGRANRPGSSDPDQALLQKHQDLSEALRDRRITPEQARRALSFKEQKRLLELRNASRSREIAEAADY